MFTLNDDLSIYATRGDIVFFTVGANEDGEPYSFKAGNVLRMKVYGKKDAENVVLQKDFPIIEDCTEVDIVLTREDTKIGDTISKPKDYWYEVVLNDDKNLPQTIIGYDEDGPKVFKLFPEGDDIPPFEPEPEDVSVMDDELDMTSTRPVQNQAIARAVVSLRADINKTREEVTEKAEDTDSALSQVKAAISVERKRIDNFTQLKEGSTTGDAELQDIRVGDDGIYYETAGDAVRVQLAVTKRKLDILGDFAPDPNAWQPVNVLEGYSWGDAGYSYDTVGEIVSTEYTKNFTPLTELIPAVPGASYQSASFIGQVRIYTKDKTQLDLVYNNAMQLPLSFTAPVNAHYLGIYYRHDIVTTEDMVSAMKLYRTTMTAEEMRTCPMVFIGRIPGEAILDGSISKDKLAGDVSGKSLYGKTIVNFGDSIFGNARPPQDISTYLAELTGATVHNCGFGGCRMSYHPSTNYDAFSMTKLADAVAGNDFSAQEAAVLSTEGDIVPGYFKESVELLKSIDFGSVDIITIAYGANDFNGVTLENKDNRLDKWTFAGALRYSIETILTAYPHIRIFICSPTYRFWIDSSYAFTEDSDTKINSANYLTTDLLEKAKEIAAEYKLPYIDNYYALGINKFNRLHYFPATDGAHHNDTGRKLIAAHIAKELF